MIWPSRVSILVRSKLLETIDEIVTGFQLSVDTVHTLLKYCDRRYVDPEHTVTVNHTNSIGKPRLSVIAEGSEVHSLKCSNTTDQTPPGDLGDSVIIEIKSLSLATPPENANNFDPSDDPNASLVGTPQQTYIVEDLAKCDENFKLSLKSLGAVTKLIKTMSAALVIVDSEPDFLNRFVNIIYTIATLPTLIIMTFSITRPFPHKPYKALIDSLTDVSRSVYFTMTSARSLRMMINQLMSDRLNVRIHMGIFRFVSDKLFVISDKANTALKLGRRAFHE